ncbi:AraC family transcriptional regulator [Vallitalea okinawensis]|uniref:AraC family transcriptional regulator n=1 Tax=Vallitalea okinawensis TaxID=2078660 RepID=UPI000CFD3F5B|nr:AraC family transcriptional regulator [Vallitalea okinawensis]
MDVYGRIQRSIDFIEENLTETLSLKEIAAQAYYSLSYFHNVFSRVNSIALKEYIRKRRLAFAAYELISANDKIIDIAFKYQYESAESFTRAFTKLFGVTPSMYRKNKKHIVVFQKINLSRMKLKKYTGGNSMEPRVIEMDEIKLIGIELRTSFDDSEFTLSIKELWNRYVTEKLGDKIPNPISPEATLGVNMDYDKEGNFSYIICKEVNSLAEIPEGMVGRSIPLSKYAVFTARGNSKAEIGSSLGQVWDYFFSTWLPQSGYTQLGISSPYSISPYDQEAAPDFELYDERFTDDGFEVDVYIPIK